MSATFEIQGAACAKCAFFDVQAASSPNSGLCRYNPPVTQPSQEAHGLWPVVGNDDWCGHYRPQA